MYCMYLSLSQYIYIYILTCNYIYTYIYIYIYMFFPTAFISQKQVWSRIYCIKTRWMNGEELTNSE